MRKPNYHFKSCYSYKIIYIFGIDDARHRNLLKIGEATLNTNSTPADLQPCCDAMNKAARKRIDEYTGTAAIAYNLIYTELAIDNRNEIFGDGKVHDVLQNSNIKRVKFEDAKGKEWFKVDVDTAVAAIDAVKQGKQNLSGTIQHKFIPVIFRPEQEDAIKQTVKHFKRKTGDKMLWNAKMRFGKTLCAIEVVKRMQFKKTIIITHRPVVNENWYDDFSKIFGNTTNYLYGSKTNGNDIDFLERSGKNFVYFASMQDLRGSDVVGGKFGKNETVFNIDWDCCIVDEAHEGTTTALGYKVIDEIIKPHTKKLELSGTPFNIIDKYDGNIFTWDYIMEQDCKTRWDIEHFGDSNPYGDLPRMNIFTFNLGKLLHNKYIDFDDKAFNFAEFFRTDTNDKFIHAADVKSFLDLITKRDDSNYPFASDEYRQIFNHTLWIVPGVRAGRALSEMLQNHRIFGCFKIVNVAGDGDADEESHDALQLVKDAIKNNDYTITISCGKLTTGVTVPEWTAVFMLAGSYSTSAASYLQTIFRVQSPCKRNGKIKTDCYVFDFAPDRTLKMVAESITISTRAGKTTDDDRITLKKFLTFCPVIAIDGTKMLDYNVDNLMQQLKRVYIDRVIKSGFDSPNLYNDNLLKLDNLQLENFENLRGIVGDSKSSKRITEIVITDTGLTGTTVTTTTTTRKHKEKTAEDIAREQRRKAISILRAISIRIPLLIFGADITLDDNFTIEMLTDDKIVDDASWQEFMPNGVTKEIFREFIKYYDRDVFVGAARRIHELIKDADDLSPTERVIEIAKLFACFKNPDKETVLTPWRVVNIHMSACFGGWDFFEENHENMLDSPRRVTDVADAFTHDAKILEVNSKTGLYPLYAAYSICRNKYRAAVVFDPKLFTDVVELGGIYIQEGINNFADWSNELIEAVGETVKPWLSIAWATIKAYPVDVKFDANKITAVTQYIGALIEDEQAKTFKDVSAKFIEKLGKKDAKHFESVIRAVYVGVKRFFDDNNARTEIAIWDEVVRENIFVVCKTPMAASITRRTLVGFRNASVNTLYIENLIDELNSDPYMVVAKIVNAPMWHKEGSLMKFDFAVGNPPYQEVNSGTSNYNKSVYPLFIEMAMRIAERASLIHPARCLFNAGSGSGKWLEDFLNNPHVKVAKYDAKSSHFFSNVDIKGGIAITYYDKNKILGPIGTFIPFADLKSIHDKVVSRDDFKPLSDIVYSQKLYKLSAKFYAENPKLSKLITDGRTLKTNIFVTLKDLFFDKQPDDLFYEYVKVVGLQNSKRTEKFFRKDYVDDVDNLRHFKIFSPKANGTGEFGEKLTSSIIGKPFMCATETFVSIGAFDTEFEADAALKYVKTKFARALLGILKVTQDNTPDKWAKVPQQDFSAASDIDWSGGVEEIDRQLYAKYGLSAAEVDFIERNIAAMA